MEDTNCASNKSNAEVAKLSYCLPSRVISAVFKQFAMCHHFTLLKAGKIREKFNGFLNVAVELFLLSIGLEK